ncbi:hypothetical protein Bca52824_057854 [Brassica carinata]|uniref:Diphthine methyl ester synthase n=1 Tax=Brassica carinata TaxID=52824 RepID=A0A8X7QR93_BRACI|nr:hypothetical protein Bca52824_057854 [Brassica carinata]
MLYIIGLGLGEESDITMRGLEAVKKSQKIYMDRKRSMIEEAIDNDIAFLVVGESVIPLERYWDLSSAAVMNDVGICRLQLYHYGETVSTPFFTETWRPDSFYEKIKKNRALGLHTLCLLDIRVKEPTFESLCRGGKKQYEPPRYMTVNTAIEQLLEVEQKRGDSVYSEETECVGFARLGAEDQKILSGTMKQLESVDCGAPLHCLVIVGKTHPVEEEMLEFYKYGTAN